MATSQQSSPSGSDPEQGLAAAISRQGEVFAAAVRLIERIHTQEDLRSPSSLTAVTQLQNSLDQIVSAQQSVSLAHQQVLESGRPMSSGIRTMLGEQETVLRNLLTEIEKIQVRFESARRDLAPQLDAETRRRSMQSAYQQSLRTA